MKKSSHVPPVTNPAYLEMAVDYYDLVEIAEERGMPTDSKTLESLRPTLNNGAQTSGRRFGRAA